MKRETGYHKKYVYPKVGKPSSAYGNSLPGGSAALQLAIPMP
jgi:hypothetical protein